MLEEVQWGSIFKKMFCIDMKGKYGGDRENKLAFYTKNGPEGGNWQLKHAKDSLPPFFYGKLMDKYRRFANDKFSHPFYGRVRDNRESFKTPFSSIQTSTVTLSDVFEIFH